MTTTLKVLLEASFATATGVSYTSDNCITSLDKVTAVNEGPGVVTVSAQVISPDGSQIGTFSKALQPGGSWPFPDLVGHLLAPGGKINMVCPTASAARVRISGRQFT